MPSPMSMAPLSQEAATKPKSDFGNDYYEIAYHHKHAGRIVQSRRRSRIVRGAEATEEALRDSPSIPISDSLPRAPRPKSDLFVDGQCPSRVPQGLAVHVTGTCRRSTKSKVVVIVEKPGAAIKTLEKPSQEVNAEPTPPPTPRLGRLTTPELSDLDDAPFCDCGVEAHVIKYCQGCNREIE